MGSRRRSPANQRAATVLHARLDHLISVAVHSADELEFHVVCHVAGGTLQHTEARAEFRRQPDDSYHDPAAILARLHDELDCAIDEVTRPDYSGRVQVTARFRAGVPTFVEVGVYRRTGSPPTTAV